MGLLGKLLSFARSGQSSQSKVNTGGGYNQTLPHFSAPGDDSYPLPDDHVAAVDVQSTNGRAAVGYVDLKNEQKAAEGEKRIYARDGDGNGVVELWLKNDGSATLSNALGAIELLADGSVDINGVVIDVNGNISSPAAIEAATSLTVGGIEVLGHTHTSSTPGSPTGPMQ